MKKVSIVVPAFNEEACIPQLVKEISDVFSSLHYRYEIIVIDDGSSDNSFEAIKELAAENSSLKGIKLSRNMGHQAALDCGLKHASGDVIISMDADLQHPPLLIPKMLELWKKGYDVVVTQKLENNEYSWHYSLFAKMFYKFFNKFSHIKITPQASDFRLMSRKSLNAVLKMPEYYRFYRGLVPFVGFSTANLTFNIDKRFAGKRKYNFKQSLDLAFNGLFSFSDFALKIPIYLGLISIAIIFLYFLVVLALHFIFHTGFIRGWSSIIAIVTISFGLQFIFMGIMGMYIGKIFFEIKRRPVFFVDETVGEIEITEN